MEGTALWWGLLEDLNGRMKGLLFVEADRKTPGDWCPICHLRFSKDGAR